MMNKRIENQKNALQTNLTSRQQTALYHQMEASWDAGHTPKKPIWIPELVAQLLRLKNRFSPPVQKAACDCECMCDCQTACECG